MYERILLMGGPGTGKTHHLVEVCRWLADQGKEMWVLDLEDKVGAFLHGQGGVPKNMHLVVALSWEEVRKCIDDWKGKIKKDHWVAVDRVDLAWAFARRWYAVERYKLELADKMLKSAKSVPEASMFIPEFPRGAWEVINETYDYFITNILYLFRCNVLLTTGITSSREDAGPFEVFSSVGLAPRGQKELAHQTHTALLLSSQIERDRMHKVTRSWHYTTAKDLPGRDYVTEEPLYDFVAQYIELYA